MHTQQDGALLSAEAPWPSVGTASDAWPREKLSAALTYAREQRTSGLIILEKGQIIAEEYWPVKAGVVYRQLAGPTLPDGRGREDVASMQKSIVGALALMAQAQGRLRLEEPVSQYLKPGWSRATPEQERAITVRHVMSMTSGLDTDYRFKAAPGTAWAYNTTVYSRMIAVLEAATGERIAPLTQRWLTGPLSMSESSWETRPWVSAGADANTIGFVTSARDMARFGLMLMARGKTGPGKTIMRAEDVEALTAPSQTLNPAYGLLWWSNRETTLTSAGLKDKGLLFPHAPPQAWFALGALGRVLCIAPEQQLIIVRLGAEPEAAFTDTLWRLLRDAMPEDAPP
ncbi:MAG: beta-lactamase family protein [Rhodospirillaceae bacterium]|nr:beta-lactamase family protein [Rhodospirillaceae bacterium]